MNIFVDFDGTIAGGHSGGFAMEKEAMDETNKQFIKRKINDWLYNGHNVIIVTRGINTHIDMYFDTKLQIKHTMNSFRKGLPAIYAPTLEEYSTNGTEQFAIIKTKYVADFLRQSKTKSNYSIFADDTQINVDKMKQKYPDMRCIYAIPGDYKNTVSEIDAILQYRKQEAGSRKRKSRKLNKKKSKSRYSNYLSNWL
jgi:hypothetical protein